MKKVVALPQGNIQRILEESENKETSFNTNPKNGTNKRRTDFRANANCIGFFPRQTIKVHSKSCTGNDNKTHRLVTVLSRKITGRIHPKASQVVKNHLFPPLRDGDVSGTI